ncbi:MAG: hypothetical protein J5717_04780 [Lachnospiraceae bacterium]|nr:hypothetical protein [Lachnospiraceae bacterium]
MNKKMIKKTISAIIAMATVTLAILVLAPVNGAVGDEDNGIGAYSIVEVDELN